LRTALEVGGPTLAPLVALPLAEAHYDRGDLETSLSLLDTYLPHSRQVGFPDQLISGCAVRARIARLRGERDLSLRVLEETIQFARERSFEKLLLMLTAERIDLLCRYGEIAEATRVAGKVGLRRAAESVMPRPRITRARAALAYAWTALALAQGRYAEAIKVARKWRNLTEAAGALRDALRWSVRLTVLLRRAGDDTGAQRELHRAEGIAAANGLLQILAEEGDGLAAAPPAPARPVKGSSVRVIPEGSLSPREIEILRLVGDGLSNAEVGQRLSLVEGSVKWHLQRIYDKIGTRRRLVAVDRARRMGLFR
jgi:LuxR family maltose regulon positive regulatory protein